MVTAVDLVAVIVAPERLVHVEVIEEGVVLGQVVRGDLLTLAWRDAEGERLVEIVARRAVWTFVMGLDREPTPIAAAPVPPELVPILRRSKHGRAGLRERVLRAGDRVRLRAILEPSGQARFVVRSDLGPIRLDEVLAFDGGEGAASE